MNYRMVLSTLCAVVFAFALQPVLASTHTTQDAENYEATISNTQWPSSVQVSSAADEIKLQKIRNLLRQLSTEELEEFTVLLEEFALTVPTNHPNYYMLDLLASYVDTLLIEREGPSDSIVDIVVDTPDVSILKDVVLELGLEETLAGEWPFTVFAPTNEAFQALLDQLDMSFEELAANPELLETVVLYHVVPWNITESDVAGLTQWTLVETVGWESVRVNNWNGVAIDDSNVIATDILATNGTIHLIDEVLLPPSVRMSLWLPTDRGDANLVDTAVNNGSFPTLVAAVQAAWLVDTLANEWPFTVYAPTEAAFADLLATLDLTAEELLADTDLLTDVLTYHVVPWFYTADDITGLSMPIQSPTVQGSALTIDPHNGSPVVNSSNIVATDVFATNWVIHVIDHVLLPPTE